MKFFKKKKFLLVLIGAIVIITGVVKAFNGSSADTGGIFVETANIETKDLSSIIYTSGIVESKEKKEVYSDLSARMKEVLKKEGEKVKKGEILGVIDSEEYKDQLEKLKLDVEIARLELTELRNKGNTDLKNSYKNALIQYNEAEKKYNKNKKLYEASAISQSSFDEIKAAYNESKNNLDASKALLNEAENSREVYIQEKKIQSSEIEMEKLERKIEESVLKSPMDGVVTNISVEEDKFINQSEALFVIQDLDNYEIVTDISEFDINNVDINQTVDITGESFDGDVYEGKVSEIKPSAITNSNGQSMETVVEVIVDVVEEKTNLKPNFSVNLELLTDFKEDALVVPYECLKKNEKNEYIIYVINDKDIIEFKKVSLGIKGDLYVEVLNDSLKKDSLVVLNPSEELEDGLKVSYSKGEY